MPPTRPSEPPSDGAGTDLADLARAWPVEDTRTDDYRREGLASTRLVDVLALPVGGGRGAVAVAADRASGALRCVPVIADAAARGGWRRARAGDGVAAGLLRRMGEGRSGAFSVDAAAPVDAVSGDERAVGVDQTNETVVVDGRVGVKWLDAPDPARERAPMLLRHLAGAGFGEVPRLLGTLGWRPRPDGAPVTLAMVDAWLPDARDGWDWCVAALQEHVAADHRCDASCPAAFADDLGALIARLHVAFATPTAVIPDPVGRVGGAAVTAWAAGARSALDLATDLTAQDDAAAGAALAAGAGVLRQRIGMLDGIDGALVQPIHGDLHVGQVLAGPHGLAVIDLDGNPTLDPAAVLAPAPAARDVAGMLCSLDHVGRIAIQRGAGAKAVEAWIGSGQAAFVAAYRAGLAAGGRSELLDERLVPPFLVEQTCRDLVYAARHLPRWRYAPMGTIRAMVSG